MSEGPVNSPEIRRLHACWNRGTTTGSVTDKNRVHRSDAAGFPWLACGISVSFIILMVLLGSIAWLIVKALEFGASISHRLGLCDRQFRSGGSVSATPARSFPQFFFCSISNGALHQPLAEAMTLFAVACRRHFPGIHVGRPWMRSICSPIQAPWGLAAVPQSAHLGCVCGLDVWDGFRSFLVCRFDP